MVKAIAQREAALGIARAVWGSGRQEPRAQGATSLPQPTTTSADTTECTRLVGSIHVDEYRPVTVVDSIRSLAIVILGVVKSLEDHYKGKRTHGNIRDVNVVVDENGRGVLLERNPVVLSIWDDPLYKLDRERLHDDWDKDEDRNEDEDKVHDEDENEDKNEDEDEEEEDVSNYVSMLSLARAGAILSLIGARSQQAGDAFLTQKQLVVDELGPFPVCPWHDIEALTYVACWVTFVWAREQTEDPELNALGLSNWREWRCLDYALMSKDHALRRPERSLKTFIRPFEKKWPGFVEFIWILRDYCGLGMDYETSMLGKEELELERRWADGLLSYATLIEDLEFFIDSYAKNYGSRISV
ncbi:BZ3500_MvSof-1268-A1-R1_Chr3-1g06040 [Microbotryum saponariae]|uniref:BZ3500_MvSof-1268-A1-R1_Chr3-1g06040 protein n=1 Tax=Microbotryum saponariae TaxID=289078 RepID=A0A2X0LFI3_9BASI|nr:BZ3500_MvSof-1268-A1-R1_Chr3-1g06040 [Microbotryum saponariae]SDA03850.1 BZ3501_MvSof-1269-A2-R1_Chr3-2g05725 [Microbotryum saponariae]